ncbi:hypothetical protein ABPG74_015224 [Tetrahymena malaccensis]
MFHRSNGIKRFILLALCLSCCFAFNIYTYTSQAVDMKEKTHPLHYKSEFYDFVSRTFRLSNGNQVQCKIPIFSTINQNFLPTLEEEFQSSQANATIPISQQSSTPISAEEGDRILQSLQNQCAEYKTSQFLWQFCYKKYLRQFDDLSTIQEAQKQAFEDIYAGYHTFYNNITNLTTEDYNKTWNSQNYYEIDNHLYEKTFYYVNKVYNIFPHIPASNISDNFFLKIEGHVIQLNGFNTSLISNSQKWSISFNTTSEIPKNKLSNSLFKNLHETVSHSGSKYYYEYEYLVHFFVDKNFALAETEFPSDIQISTFQISYIKDNKLQTNLELLRIFNGQYIYGKKLNALKHFSSDDLIIVHLYNQVFIKKVKKVWFHNLIELYVDNQGKNLKSNDFFIQSIQIFNRNKIYEIQKNGNLDHLFKGYNDIYFEFTNFPKKERFISGRYLLNFQHLNGKLGDNLIFISKNSYEVIRIKNIIAGIIELDQPLDYFNGFIMKANSIKNKQSYFDYYPSNKNIQTRSILLDQSKFFIPKTPINSKKKQYPLILSFKSIQDEISSDSDFLPFTDLEGFSFSKSDLNKQRFFSFFIPQLLIKEDFSQFKLLITDSLEQINEGIEIVFSNENLILAYDIFDKKNIVSKNKRYENSTLYDTTVWILLDTDNTLRLGFSQVISPSSQVLQLSTNYTNLRYFRILTKHTVNFHIKYPYLDVISRPINFSILNPNVKQFRGQTIYQNYYNGEFCSVINGPRRFKAEFICGESFFSILSVTEPSTCVYKVVVETYLLCENHIQTYNIPPPPKNIYCVLKDK